MILSRRIQSKLLAVVAVVVAGCDLFSTHPNELEATIRGVVIIDGVPAPNVSVQIYSPGGFSDREGSVDYVVTDANGQFERQLPSGAPTITVNSAEDRFDERRDVDCPERIVQVDVRGGETRSLTFECKDVTPFTLSAAGGFDHNTGIPGQSLECKRITTSPPRAGATYSMTVNGPINRDPPGGGVVPGQGEFTGTLDENGTAWVRVKISRVGIYRNTIVATSKGGVARIIALDVNVTTGPSPNPCQ